MWHLVQYCLCKLIASVLHKGCLHCIVLTQAVCVPFLLYIVYVSFDHAILPPANIAVRSLGESANPCGFVSIHHFIYKNADIFKESGLFARAKGDTYL